MEKGGQVWVETVIYILIGLSIIGILLAVINPKINEMKDKAIIDSMIIGLNEIDYKINDVKIAQGSKRLIEIGLKKGKLIIDATNNQINFTLENIEKEYSQIGKEVKSGNRLKIKTTKEKGIITVTLSLKYDNLDILYEGNSGTLQEFNAASLPYKLSIENIGEIGEGFGTVSQIDISSIS